MFGITIMKLEGFFIVLILRLSRCIFFNSSSEPSALRPAGRRKAEIKTLLSSLLISMVLSVLIETVFQCRFGTVTEIAAFSNVYCHGVIMRNVLLMLDKSRIPNTQQHPRVKLAKLRVFSECAQNA